MGIMLQVTSDVINQGPQTHFFCFSIQFPKFMYFLNVHLLERAAATSIYLSATKSKNFFSRDSKPELYLSTPGMYSIYCLCKRVSHVCVAV